MQVLYLPRRVERWDSSQKGKDEEGYVFCMGTTRDSFQSEGKVPVEREELKINVHVAGRDNGSSCRLKHLG